MSRGAPGHERVRFWIKYPQTNRFTSCIQIVYDLCVAYNFWENLWALIIPALVVLYSTLTYHYPLHHLLLVRSFIPPLFFILTYSCNRFNVFSYLKEWKKEDLAQVYVMGLYVCEAWYLGLKCSKLDVYSDWGSYRRLATRNSSYV